MNAFQITYTIFLFITFSVLFGVSMPIFSERKTKRKHIREFDNLKIGDIYIDKDDEDDPFEDIEDYAVILNKKLNDKGVRYVQYMKVSVMRINAEKSSVETVVSKDWETFLRIYTKTNRTEI